MMAQFSKSDTSDDAACVRAIISHDMVTKNAVPMANPTSQSRRVRLHTVLLKINASRIKAMMKRTARRLKGGREAFQYHFAENKTRRACGDNGY